MTILNFSEQISDHRMERNRIHSVTTIVFISICAVLSGAESWNEIEQFGRCKIEYFRKRLPDFTDIPSHDTFNRFFSLIDTNYFERHFRHWVNQLCGKYKGVVAIDGKTMTGSSRMSSTGNSVNNKLHIISAFAVANGISLGQLKVNDKSNEITVIPKLLDALDIAECIITIDAMGCQKKIAKKIIKGKADYILAVKENQKTLYKDLVTHFEQADENLLRERNFPATRWAFYTTEEKAHSCREVRRCIVYYNGCLDKVYKEWDGINTIVRIESERINEKTGKVSIEKRYFISSLPLNAKLIADAVRKHWSVENNLHWQLDVSFREDDSRKRNNAAINFSLICKMALALLKHDNKNASIAAKRKIAGWDEEYLDGLLQVEKFYMRLACYI